MTRRARSGALAAGVFILLTLLYFTLSGSSSDTGPLYTAPNAEARSAVGAPKSPQSPLYASDDAGAPFRLPADMDILSGGAIAPKLENATIKQELGRASWRLLHTMMARFPEEPTADESLALQTYIQLFGRLYPCGDCAAHFQKLLKKYPPQTSSRNAAAGWACFVHNEVNQRLKKEIFDCNTIGDFYDCGCGDEDKGKSKDKSAKEKSTAEKANKAVKAVKKRAEAANGFS